MTIPFSFNLTGNVGRDIPTVENIANDESRPQTERDAAKALLATYDQANQSGAPDEAVTHGLFGTTVDR